MPFKCVRVPSRYRGHTGLVMAVRYAMSLVGTKLVESVRLKVRAVPQHIRRELSLGALVEGETLSP